MSLLSQAADCLETFVAASSEEDQTRQEARLERLQAFESQAQSWFETLNNVQMGLRSAVKNLRKDQRLPITYNESTMLRTNLTGRSGNLGSATKGHTLGLLLSPGDEADMGGEKRGGDHGDQKSLMDSFVGPSGADASMPSRTTLSITRDEAKLSLSALRLQDRAWTQLADCLQDLRVERQSSDHSNASSIESDHTATGERTAKRSKAAQDRADLVSEIRNAQNTQDSRLLTALLQMNQDVLPGQSLTQDTSPP